VFDYILFIFVKWLRLSRPVLCHSAIHVRCGSERTGFLSNEAAIMNVKASRPSLADPEDSQQCQCSGEFVLVTLQGSGKLFSLSRVFRKISVGDLSPYFLIMRGTRTKSVTRLWLLL
jgi:hypothetical protein